MLNVQKADMLLHPQLALLAQHIAAPALILSIAKSVTLAMNSTTTSVDFVRLEHTSTINKFVKVIY